MKNSKTTIKELTRQYRSVLKKCLFLNAVALGVLIAANPAAAVNADTDLSNITDAGKAVIINAARTDAGYVDPDKTAYKFKDPNGQTVNLETGKDLTADDYVADSAAKTETGYVEGIASAPDLKYNTGSVDASNYEYVTYDNEGNASNKAGNVDVAHLTKALELHELAGSKSITVSSDDGATDKVTIADYKLVSGTGTDIHTYTIEKDGDNYVLKRDTEVDTTHDDFKTMLVNAYKADVSNYDTLKGKLDEYYRDSVDNKDLIAGFVTTDNAKIAELSTNETAMETQRTNYSDDKGKYTGSLGEKIDNHISNAITADNGIIKTAAEQFIATTAANVEKDQLGWDITASPADEGSFAKSLTGGIYADLIAGEDRTVVGALNKIGEFIGTERTDDADPTGLYAVLENKEANISAQLGYNVANNPTNKKAENSLINKLNSDLVEELGTNVSVVDAINQAYTDAISRTVTLKEDGAIAEISDGTTTATLYTKQAADAKFAQYSDWAQNVLGIDEATMAKGAANQVQTVLTQLAADDGTINNIEASSIIGAIHELDQEKAKLIGNNTFEGTNEFRQGIIISDFSTLDNKTVGLTASDVGLKLSSGLEATEAVLSDSLTLAGTKVTGISSDEITDDGSDSTLATTKAVAATVAVEAELRKNGDAEIKGMIGDGFDSTNTVAKSITDLNNALVSGDSATYTRAVADANNYTDVRFNQLDHKIDKLEDRMEKGLAANAALAGLTPLPSSEHKTQISAAMGGYGSNQALAIGGYHYINDRTLLNAGAAYGGNSDISYKVGVTFGF